MIIKTPQNGRWSQTNLGDITGNLWSTRNIDFNRNFGKALISAPIVSETISTDNTNPQSTPFGFAKHFGSVSGTSTNRYWTVAKDDNGDTRVFETSSVTADFDLDTVSPTMTADPDKTDIIEFNNRLYVASDDDLHRRSSSSWTLAANGTLMNDSHVMSVYGNRLYIAGGNNVYSIDTAEALATSGAYTLDIDNAGNENLEISCMRNAANGLWIGTFDREGGRAKVFFWDGLTENLTDAAYKIPSVGAAAIAIYNERPYVLGANGILYTLNGSYFTEVARFDLDDKFLYRFQISGSNDRFVHPNGMIVIEDEILIAFNNRSGEDDVDDDNVPERCPSGVWAYNPNVGLYHKYSISSQLDNATIRDYAQVELAEIGSLWPLKGDDKIDETYQQANFVVGFSYKYDNSTTRHAIGTDWNRNKDSAGDSFNQMGIIITPEYYASQVKEVWQNLYVRLNSFDITQDTLKIKYRTQISPSTELKITWVNDTSFTCTTIVDDPEAVSLATLKSRFEAGTEYEFEGLQGDGGGCIAQVTNITESGGTYTFTIDTAIPVNGTNTAKCRIAQWNYAGALTLDTDIEKFLINKKSSKIQFKIVLFGKPTRVGIEEIISVSEVDTTY